jgi:uncharacterized protein (TIRG00374 family)
LNKNFLVWIIRFTLGVIVLWFLLEGHFPLEKLRQISLKTVAWISIISFLMVFLISLRLSILLAIQNIELSIIRSYGYCCLGLLTALFIPSALSGDVSKSLLLIKDNPEHKTSALYSVLLDRVIGTLSLGGIATLFNLFFWLNLDKDLPAETYDNFLILSWISIGFTLLAFILFVFCLFQKFWEWKPFRLALSKLSKALHSEDMSPIFSRCRENYKPLIWAFLLSCINHLLRSIVFFMICNEIGVVLGFFEVGFIVSLASFVNIIPISPGNFGTGDVAFGSLFEMLGESSGSLVSVLARIVFYLPAFYGIAVLLLARFNNKSLASNANS